MKTIGGAAPGSSWADHFSAIRDNSRLAQPANPSEAIATGDLHAPMVPSKAHKRRLERHAKGLVSVKAARAYPEASDHTKAARVQLATYHRVIAELGGSRTVAPIGPTPKIRRPDLPVAALNYIADVWAEPRHVDYAAANERLERQAEAERVKLRAWRLARDGAKRGPMIAADIGL